MAWRKSGICVVAALVLALATPPALAQKKYGPGVTDTEIKIGTTTPFSGPASAYSAGAVSATAYFAMINEQGGVNGRKVNYVALDDAYPGFPPSHDVLPLWPARPARLFCFSFSRQSVPRPFRPLTHRSIFGRRSSALPASASA